ncbi:MAG: ABC transporter substrate-binding protein, partial [Alphaproteobacteria bacterium]
FSFLLRRMLADNGLENADYKLVPVGAPPARWRAIESGDCAAALLSEAFAAIAGEAGCAELRSDPDPWACYQGGVYAARRGWTAQNADTVKAFIRATVAATGWILDPANAAALPDLLMRHLPHMGEAAARAAAAALQGPAGLLKPGLPINIEGFRAVLALRAKYGRPPVTLGTPEKYLDLDYCAAVQMRG